MKKINALVPTAIFLPGGYTCSFYQLHLNRLIIITHIERECHLKLPGVVVTATIRVLISFRWHWPVGEQSFEASQWLHYAILPRHADRINRYRSSVWNLFCSSQSPWQMTVFTGWLRGRFKARRFQAQRIYNRSEKQSGQVGG